jgi:hypothetical protein
MQVVGIAAVVARADALPLMSLRTPLMQMLLLRACWPHPRMLCHVDGHHFWWMLCCHVVTKAPPMHMLCCYERDGPIRGCFAVSMLIVLADVLPPWFRRMLGYRGRRFCGYTTLLPTIVLSLLMLGSVGWGCMVEVPPPVFLLFICACGIRW